MERESLAEASGPTASATTEPRLVGSWGLAWRRSSLRGLEWVYGAGVRAGSATLLGLGGFVPVVSGWLRDEVKDWGDVIETLGGVRVVTESKDPDADFGPAIGFADAPTLFTAISEVARRLGARPPDQVRLGYLPCCGVVAWKRTRALMIGLPLLHVLNLVELRAVLAHEMAHLARGDATRSVRSARFVHSLGRAIDLGNGRAGGPLLAWAKFCRRRGETLLAPVARGQEARADRTAATIAGGDAAASALVKVALVQPLFREVLENYDPADPDFPNLYSFFRSFWSRLPEPLQTDMRLRLVAGLQGVPDPAHPPLPDRLAIVQSYPHRPSGEPTVQRHPIGDLEPLEQMLHNRLFSADLALEPSIFHRAGT
ncbi:MAG: hypothetical protein NVSMB14_05560 [Isosphaeraceae bacterium]